jgi:hypothetical protein
VAHDAGTALKANARPFQPGYASGIRASEIDVLTVSNDVIKHYKNPSFLDSVRCDKAQSNGAAAIADTPTTFL